MEVAEFPSGIHGVSNCAGKITDIDKEKERAET